MRTIQFPFENITGAQPDERRMGLAHIAFDGAGEYRVTAIELHNARRSLTLLPGSPSYAEVAETLIRERGEDIAARLNQALEQGAYMALHGRNMPRGALPAAPAAHLAA